MKPRSDTNSKARPQRRATEVHTARNGQREANCRTSLTRKLPGDEKTPADRGACEHSGTTEGSE